MDENYDLTFMHYYDDVPEEIEYKKPEVILQSLIDSEIGEGANVELFKNLEGGIVKELLELKEMIV